MSGDPSKYDTVRGEQPDDTCEPGVTPAPTEDRLADGQHADHWVLNEAERAKGYIRPVRYTYVHLKCGVVTRMPASCAETYARQPDFYGSTFCCGCRGYFRVGAEGEFRWDDGSGTKVGT